MVRLESESHPVLAAYHLCDLGQIIAVTMLSVKITVLAVGGSIPGDVIGVTLDSPASCCD